MGCTITIVRGEQPGVNGVELDNPNVDAPVFTTDLPAAAEKWALDRWERWSAEHGDVWVLVTPSDEDVEAMNVLEQRTF